ncbi:MAG TPA: hypothetical protein VKA46_43210 [Gemmataceae bacterium]|nr:hypothetical protein [Gemmataceae bacterium]
MNWVRTSVLAALVLFGLSWTSAQAGVFIGVGIPGPFYRHPYRPRIVVGLPPVYIGAAPAPVYVVAPPPTVYVQPAPAVIQAPPPQPVSPPPAYSPVPPPPSN